MISAVGTRPSAQPHFEGMAQPTREDPVRIEICVEVDWRRAGSRAYGCSDGTAEKRLIATVRAATGVKRAKPQTVRRKSRTAGTGAVLG